MRTVIWGELEEVVIQIHWKEERNRTLAHINCEMDM
jgi:hypothetical protein